MCVCQACVCVYQACVCVCTKLVYSNLYSYLQPSTTRATSPQKRETRHHRTRHRGKHTLTRQLYVILYTVPCARGPSKRPCRLVCFCVLCVRPRSHAPALAPQQHEALWCDHSHAPASNTKPFGVIMVYLFHPSLLLRYVNIK